MTMHTSDADGGSTRDYVGVADEHLRGTYEEPMSLREYVDAAFERPSIAAHASKYLLDAIESMGTRTVFEEGDTRERYRFFDDPENDGEHAVLGNTDVLNAFVDDLRTIATDRGKAEKILWFNGPTATGKSELKRCLINGLRAYSTTEAGRRYTVEWNVATGGSDTRGLSYGGETTGTERESDWYESPVQTHPLSVFPRAVREELLAALNDTLVGEVPIVVDQDLDPFSREAYELLEERYRRNDTRELFSTVTDPQHLRVKNYVVDVGRGIGVLHSEDDGSPKERLVGSWMPGMLRELDSRGRKNPQAFSYDGVLSQGNGLLTIVEDASQHADLLQKLLNVPDEGHVKLDKGIGMDVDSQLLIISNPNLDAELDKYAERNDHDPLKALKRRLDKQELRYLTTVSLEAELIRRELTDETAVWDVDDEEELRERVRAPLSVHVRNGPGEMVRRELAPHTIAAAAMYSVLSRLDSDDVPNGYDLLDKALLFDVGYIEENGDRTEIDALAFEGGSEGTHGIPVTFTRDIIAELLQNETDRRHPELAVENVVLPDDVLDSMVSGLHDAPVFSRAERAEYEGRAKLAREYVRDRQESEVLAAMFADHSVDRKTVAEYVEHVYAWDGDEQIETERGPVDPDPLRMKLFEIEQLGRFTEDDYLGTAPTETVKRFRREKIITALNRYAWQNRDEEFAADDVELSEIPVIRSVLDAHGWADIRRRYEDFDPAQWDDPPANTQTARLKAQTIDELVARGYTPASAELTSRAVMREVREQWD